MDVIREMVRDVLAEEIGNLRRAGQIPAEAGVPGRQVREETVSIRSDADLRAFVARLREILKDGRSGQEIEQGRWVFRLDAAAAGTSEQRGPPASAAAPASSTARIAGPPASAAAPASSTARIETGVVSERQIEGLAPGITSLIVGKSVRLTPLALDRLRMLGISLKRSQA
jgi:hypothetical protein